MTPDELYSLVPDVIGWLDDIANSEVSFRASGASEVHPYYARPHVVLGGRRLTDYAFAERWWVTGWASWSDEVKDDRARELLGYLRGIALAAPVGSRVHCQCCLSAARTQAEALREATNTRAGVLPPTSPWYLSGEAELPPVQAELVERKSSSAKLAGDSPAMADLVKSSLAFATNTLELVKQGGVAIGQLEYFKGRNRQLEDRCRALEDAVKARSTMAEFGATVISLAEKLGSNPGAYVALIQAVTGMVGSLRGVGAVPPQAATTSDTPGNDSDLGIILAAMVEWLDQHPNMTAEDAAAIKAALTPYQGRLMAVFMGGA